MAATYARRVGDRLRGVRRQQQLSLHGVEAASGQEFKASVLGAYERGERAISVPRLRSLARLYDVPVDQLLPDDLGNNPAQGARVPLELATRNEMPRQGKLRIDL